MNIRFKYLSQFKKDQVFVDVYTDDYETSDYGFILDFNDTFLLLERFSSNCVYEGITVFYLENVSRIRWQGNEINSANSLIDLQTRTQGLEIDLSSMENILRSVYKTFNHVALHTQDLDTEVCFIGQIHELDSESLVMHEFGSMKSLDRTFIWLALEHITKVEAGGVYEKNLLKLFGV